MFHAADPVSDITAKVQRQLHTPGTSWPIKWVTVHTANKDDPPSLGSMQMPSQRRRAPRHLSGRRTWPGCRARAFALSSSARPATRTRPPARFRSWRHAAPGARSSALTLVVTTTIRRITTVKESRAKDGAISIFVLGDQEHSSFDNLAFANERQLLATEDRGDTLHDQLQKLNSVWAFDVKTGHAQRCIALGRDLTASLPGAEDNEPTGIYVSSGSPRREGLLGTEESLQDARGFFTKQHGDNTVFEIVRKPH